MSKEYTLAVALTLGVILKSFGIEIENHVLEATIFGLATISIAIFRYAKGDINVLGRKV
jgi:hypothetical protein